MIKRGDLVYDSAIGKFGIVMTWSMIGGTGPSLWEIMYEDNEIGDALECEISVIDKNWRYHETGNTSKDNSNNDGR
tara:strand:- start:539 stop:766 length:228 start_codon:yes stop_codon:yes gene_type:complete